MIARRTLLASALALAAAPLAAAPLSGVWRVEMDHPGGPLPFGLEVSADGRKAWLLNPPERLPVEALARRGNALLLSFPSYGSELRLEPDGTGLKGSARLIRRDGPVTLGLRGSRDRWRFSAKPGAPSAVQGRWQVTTGGARPQTGVGQFRAQGPLVAGSIQFPTGDTRYLSGEVSGGRLSLSTFDGNSTSLWIGDVKGDRIAGAQWGATSREPTAWTAVRAGPASTDGVSVEKLTPAQIRFAFADSSGRRVALSDPRFRGKVVLVSIGGAWCPNCHDEARFLGPYASRRKADGLEVIGLQFEYGTDRIRAFRQLDSFAARYKLPYPLLLAGQPTPDSTAAALPQIGGVKVYPTTLLIDRKGRLRELHTGWAGPATGALHKKVVADLDAAVTRLLKEPG